MLAGHPCYFTLVYETVCYLFCLQDREWICAQNADGKYISKYARDYPEREDMAESLVPWLAVRYRSSRSPQVDIDRVTRDIPNRLQYFDQHLSPKFPQ